MKRQKLEKSFRLTKWSLFAKDRRGPSFVPVKFNLPFHRWARLAGIEVYNS